MKKEIWEAIKIAENINDIKKLDKNTSTNAFAFAHDVLRKAPILLKNKELWFPMTAFVEHYLKFFNRDITSIKIRDMISESVKDTKLNEDDFFIKKLCPNYNLNGQMIYFMNLEKAANDMYNIWSDFLGIQSAILLCCENTSLWDLKTNAPESELAEPVDETPINEPDPKADIQPKTNKIIIKKQITPKMANLLSYLKQLGFENSILETDENIYTDAGGIVMLLFDYVFQTKTMKEFPALTAFMPNGQQKDVIPLESLPGFLEEFADLFFDIIQEIKNASEQEAYVESDISSA